MNAWIRANRGFVLFLLLLGVFRTAVADWNPIPSGSMRPTLLEGDVVFVNRLAYDVKVPLTGVSVARLGEPQRGDLVTFFAPENDVRMIKRVIGLPGDRVEMRERILVVNGVAATYTPTGRAHEPEPGVPGRVARYLSESLEGRHHTIQWLAPDGRPGPGDFAAVRVPPDHYLMLGDNRDNSRDSRAYGFVPREQLIGRASFILVSADTGDGWRVRTDRIGASLRPER